MKKIIFLTLCLTCTNFLQATLDETYYQRFSLAPPLDPQELLNENNQGKEKIKLFPFVSCSAFSGVLPIPGVGISARTNTLAFDGVLETMPLAVYKSSILFMPIYSVTASRIFYKQSTSNPPYWSVGGCLSYCPNPFLPLLGVTVPIRYGKEYDKGFWDIGVKPGILLVYSEVAPIISSEVRGGIKF